MGKGPVSQPHPVRAREQREGRVREKEKGTERMREGMHMWVKEPGRLCGSR